MFSIARTLKAVFGVISLEQVCLYLISLHDGENNYKYTPSKGAEREIEK
jgi:hypothetical protein